MLVAGQRVADQDRVRLPCIERAVGLVADLDLRKARAAVECQRPRQHDVALQAEALIALRSGV